MRARNRTLASTLLPVGLILPPAVLLVIVFIRPFLRVLTDGLFPDGRFSTAGFAKVAELYLGDVAYTVFIAVTSLALTLLGAVLIGAYLRLHACKWIEFLFKIPLFIPYVVVGHAMRTFLAPHGTLNSLLSVVGLVDLNNPPSLAFSSAGIIIALVWKNLAFALLLVMAPFQGVSDAHLQAAQNFGAGFFRQTKDVLVPMCKSALFVSGILLFTSMMGSFSIPMMMGNGSGPQMLMVDLYYRMTYQNDMVTANALGILSFMLSFGAAWYYIKKVVAKP